MSKKARVLARRKKSAGRKVPAKVAKPSGGQAKRADALKRRSDSARRASPDVLQFAPNFTVYVLPPDAVCLYSEDRKFFLHGELYCALVTAIGERRRALPSLRGNWRGTFRPTRSRKLSSG